jgi:ParB-like nuclease family protein
MLDEEELEELAFDIKNNGLQQPLVVAELGDEPLLVDGRNRREACRRAGVIPDYVLFDGADPVAYILSANINRRHMTKGQRAVVVARIHPEPKRGIHSEFPEETGELSKAHLSRARFVVRYASDLADSVRDGSISLNNAYEEARSEAADSLRIKQPTLAKVWSETDHWPKC